MAVRLLAALVAGSLIGYERSFHGRPAGFRTHALVCTASSVPMLVTVYEAHWMRASEHLVQIDPTRMAQGIMTGIGFLGAGVIIKEGLSVRGLTTAASIWITSAIGISRRRRRRRAAQDRAGARLQHLQPELPARRRRTGAPPPA
jgi:putative Mg2+ transporter-C (MgtC) family protein